MSQELCRTCALPAPTLLPLFPRPERPERYASALQLATGLQIKLNDGLPQQICNVCTKAINNILKFRKSCLQAHHRLSQLGFRKRTTLVSLTAPTPEELIETDEETLKHKHIKEESPDNSRSVSPTEEIDVFDGRIKVEIELIESQDINAPVQSLVDKESTITESRIQTDVPVQYDALTHKYAKGKSQIIGHTDTGTKRKDILKENIPLHLLWRTQPPKYKRVLDEFLDKSSPVYTCNVCSKVYKQKASFVAHTLVHTGFEFMCEVCGKTFRNATKLLRHQRSLHGAERDSRLQCAYCHFHALDPAHLKEHTRTHTGERPYICDSCGAGFTCRELLVQHLTVHITERTVQCEQCPAKFRTRKCLNTHRSKRHRPRLWRYRCPYCPNVYSVYNKCRCHVRKAHGDCGAEQRGPVRVPI